MRSPILCLGIVLILIKSTFLSAQCTVPPTPSISGLGICASSPLTGTLFATGNSSLQTSWYASAYGGNAVGTGSSYVAAGTSSVYYVAQLTSTATASLTMPAQTSTLSGLSRGYYFTAPASFVITGVRVPTDASSGNSNIAIVKFTNGAPPIYSALTNSFNTLYLTQNNTSGTGVIPVYIPIYAGDIIGVLGDRSDIVSYASVGPYTTTLGSNTFTLNRMGMQYPLSSTAPLDLWSEAAPNIARIELYTTLGCLNGLTAYTMVPAANPAISISGLTSSLCIGKTATLTASGASTYSWSNGTASASTTVNPVSLTAYSVTGTSTAACTGTQAITVSVAPVPTVTISGPSVTCEQTAITLTASGASSYLWDSSANTASVTVTPTSNITYSVTGTDALTNCSVVATKSILVNPSPPLSISPITTICAGTSLTLTAGGADLYNWSTGAQTSTIVVSPTLTTNYVLNGTITATGCSTTIAQVISVQMLPNVTITGPASACLGSTINLFAGGADTYTWSNGATSPAIAASPTSAVNYTITGTNTLTACSNTAHALIAVLPLPPLSVSAPTTACHGDVVTLGASGANAYVWSTGSTSATTTQTLTATNTYSVIGTDNTTGCSSSSVFSIPVNPTPTLAINPPVTVCAGSPATLTASGANTYTWTNAGTGSSVVVNPTSTTIYSVTGSFTLTGCRSTISTVVNVNALPPVPVVGPSEICAGNVLVLSTGGANTYSWSTGDITAAITDTPSTNTTYTVTGTNTLTGCVGKTVHSVTVHPLPVVTVTADVTKVCLNGAPVVLTGNPPYGNFYGQNVNGNLFNPNLIAGTFSITYIYTDPATTCFNTSGIAIVVENCTGISELSHAASFRVFPNPGSGQFFIDLGNVSSGTIEVIDLSGRILSEQTVYGERSSLDLSAYPNGVYYLNIKSPGASGAVKVIKN